MAKDKRRMQQNRAKKKARVEARKKLRKKQRAQAMNNAFAREGCSRGQIAKGPMYGAWVSDVIVESGFGEIIIARSLPDGRVAAGIFLVDTYCLGVKNAFLSILPPSDFKKRLMARIQSSHGMIEVAPSYARKLIEGAIDYARALGFEPHEDYADAQVVLGDIDSSQCHETFTFGKDGKPLFIKGPSISPQRSEAIIKNLAARCGTDGFHYLVGLNDAGPAGDNEGWDDDAFDDELLMDDEDEDEEEQP